jgi:hypothetical protein
MVVPTVLSLRLRLAANPPPSQREAWVRGEALDGGRVPPPIFVQGVKTENRSLSSVLCLPAGSKRSLLILVRVLIVFNSVKKIVFGYGKNKKE